MSVTSEFSSTSHNTSELKEEIIDTLLAHGISRGSILGDGNGKSFLLKDCIQPKDIRVSRGFKSLGRWREICIEANALNVKEMTMTHVHLYLKKHLDKEVSCDNIVVVEDVFK